MSNLKVLPPAKPKPRSLRQRPLINRDLCHKVADYFTHQITQVDASDFINKYNALLYACIHYGLDPSTAYAGELGIGVLCFPAQLNDQNTLKLVACQEMIDTYKQLLFNPHKLTLAGKE